jgi:hypothetical protein
MCGPAVGAAEAIMGLADTAASFTGDGPNDNRGNSTNPKRTAATGSAAQRSRTGTGGVSHVRSRSQTDGGRWLTAA